VQGILINPDWNLNKKEGSRDAGISIHQFKKLKFSHKFVQEGIIFVWVEKEIMSEVLVHMDFQGFNYIENVCWVHLDKSRKEFVAKQKTMNVSQCYWLDTAANKILKKAHRTLLMFRRNSTAANAVRLELRHQRTGDVVFTFKGKRPTLISSRRREPAHEASVLHLPAD